MQLPGFLVDLNQIVMTNQPLYLVGGAVRDFLLGKSCKDYDLVCSSDTRGIARKFADKAQAAIYALDGERNTYRVLIGLGSAQQTIVDFATMQGATIEEDLAKRDFTINAMALALDAPQTIIDPFKGGRDLQGGYLRPVSENSFTTDPLRVIRAIRYAVDLGLKLEPETSELLREAVAGLDFVSRERKRDELFKLLDGRNVHTAVFLLRHYEVFSHIPLNVEGDFSEVSNRCKVLEELLGWLTGTKSVEKQAAFHQVSLFVQFGRFKEKFQEHYLLENLSGRTRKALLFLILLTGEELHTLKQSDLAALALSVDEIKAVEKFYEGFSECEQLSDSPQRPTPVEIFYFFQKTGATGVDLVVYNLVRYRARIGVEFSHDEWLRRLQFANLMLSAWWEHPDLVHPEPLLNGHEIMQSSGLSAGPIIGEIHDALLHQQVAGKVTTKKQAVDWLASWLVDNNKRLIK